MGMGIYSALSGMKMKELELELTAHNLANVNTTGFKEEKIAFQAVMGRFDQSGNPENPNTPFTIEGARTHDFSPGSAVTTGNTFDCALQGNGFFEVQDQTGTYYTRDGAFTLNDKGELVTVSGDHVMGTQGIITVGQGSVVSISSSGKILVDDQEKGQIKLTSFDDTSKLKATGGGYFRAEQGANGKEDSTTTLLQGKLEQSNTNTMLSLVKLIDISRVYQNYQKIISTQSEAEKQAAQVLGSIR